MTRFLPLAFLLLAGCGGPSAPNYGGEEGKAIATLVDSFIDDRSSPSRTAKLFAQGSAPADLRPYEPFKFEVSGKPAVTGNEATATVKIQKDRDGSEAGEQTWTFVKEGNGWKIKDAPVP